MILAGDVGGTKTVLAVLEPGAGPSPVMTVVREAVLPSREIDSLENAVEAFLLGAPRLSVAAACLGVAGPVIDGRTVTTNLPWEVHERRLTAAAHAPTRLINDLEAAGHGVLTLAPEQFLTLQAGVPKPGANMALIAAGTGLGQALLIAEGQDYRVIASEGGHADFAPHDEVDVDLLRFLRAEFGHVSWERVVSGPGLHNIYRFLQMRAGHAAPEWLRERLQREDPSAVVGEVGLQGRDPVCVEALDRFVTLYGAQAGNLALASLALAGVALAAAIAPTIRGKGGGGARLAEGRGRVVLDERAALGGAGRVAARMRAS